MSNALCVSVAQPEMLAELKAEKQQALHDGAAQGRPADDMKAAAGRTYNKCKQTLGLTQCGNDSEAFARVSLAPLIRPGTAVYQELEAIVMAPRGAPPKSS
jgi:hypothetical protein